MWHSAAFIHTKFDALSNVYQHKTPWLSGRPTRSRLVTLSTSSAFALCTMSVSLYSSYFRLQCSSIVQAHPSSVTHLLSTVNTTLVKLCCEQRKLPRNASSEPHCQLSRGVPARNNALHLTRKCNTLIRKTQLACDSVVVLAHS